jgi:predicted ester cyclase
MVNRDSDARGTGRRASRALRARTAGFVAWLVAGACAPGRAPASAATESAPGVARSTTLDANRRLVERYFGEVWNGGDVDALDELLDPAYVNHTPSVPNPPPGPDGLKPIVLAIRTGFPDLHYAIEELVVTEERVVARVTMTGTHQGSLFGLAPTGRRVRVNQINIERVQGGRIVEHWRVTDELTLMRQLGAAR